MTEHTSCFPGAEYQCDERNGLSNLFLGFTILVGWVAVCIISGARFG